VIGEPRGKLSIIREPRVAVHRGGGGGARTVAVVSDGSDARGDSRSAIRTGLLIAATSLRQRIGMKATALLVNAESAEELITELRDLSGEYSAIYLVRTDPARGREAQAALSGTVPVITDRQALAAVALAATLTILTRAGVEPADGRALIIGAERDRLVATLAVAAGIGEISSWGLEDAHSYPLRALAHRATAVIDLLGPDAHRRVIGMPDPDARVVTVDDPTVALLAFPGLLAAADTAGRQPDLAVCLAWARTLAARTPADRILPALADTVPGADAVDLAAAGIRLPVPTR
jgi:hypothetical protein